MPLHRIAALGRSVEVARMLIEHGADVNARRGDGRTPYAMAVRTGNAPVAEFLAASGADTHDLTVVDHLLAALAHGDSASAHEIVKANPQIMSALGDEDRPSLVLAIEEGRGDSVLFMLSLGWSILEEIDWGGTPLHHAAWHGRPDMVKVLLESGAPVNVRDKEFGCSPIAWAAHGSANARSRIDADYITVTEILLDAGSSREASYNKWNEPPERLASDAVARVLRKRGFAA